MSISGVSIKLDEDSKFFVMMELDVKLRGDGWDDSMPALPVRVTRVDKRDVGLQFIESCEDLWMPPEEDVDFRSDDTVETQQFSGHGDLDECGELA